MDSLPEEVLEKILSQCSINDLSPVNKKFQRICLNPKIWKKLAININKKSLKSIREYENINELILNCNGKKENNDDDLNYLESFKKLNKIDINFSIKNTLNITFPKNVYILDLEKPQNFSNTKSLSFHITTPTILKNNTFSNIVSFKVSYNSNNISTNEKYIEQIQQLLDNNCHILEKFIVYCDRSIFYYYKDILVIASSLLVDYLDMNVYESNKYKKVLIPKVNQLLINNGETYDELQYIFNYFNKEITKLHLFTSDYYKNNKIIKLIVAISKCKQLSKFTLKDQNEQFSNYYIENDKQSDPEDRFHDFSYHLLTNNKIDGY